MIGKLEHKFWRRKILRLCVLLALVLSGGVAMATPVPQTQSAAAQASTVTGRVLDENGEPMIGATVTVKGTIVATATDCDGRFSISAAPGTTVTVS